jgi:hypothetical protein
VCRVVEIESQLQRCLACIALVGLVLGSLSASALGQASVPSNEELARRIQALAEELDDLRLGEVADELESRHGFGPAASKVYGVERGFSFGGYGEMVYKNVSAENENGDPSKASDQIDFLRQILYVGYKFDAHILFNAEIEFEHASTGTGKAGEVSVEFAQIDFLVKPEFNARAGLLLVPMGFVNELHEPPIFFGVNRPVVERVLIPSTWRANGLGVFGEPHGSLGGMQYRAYLVESLLGPNFEASGLRGGRQNGSKAVAEDFAGVVRADYERSGVSLGGALFFGNTSQGDRADAGAGLQAYEAFTTIYEAHAQFRYRGLQLRGLVAGADVGDADLINLSNGYDGNQSVGSKLLGWYLEVGWDALTVLRPGSRFALTPYVRYSEVNTQREVPGGFASDPADPWASNPANDQRVATFGAAFHPHSQVVVKADYALHRNEAKTGVDQWNLGLGYLF